MTSFQAGALVIGILVVFGGPLLWWVFTSGVSPEQNKAASEQFRQRQTHPDYSAFQRRFGVAPPESLKSLFSDPTLFTDNRDMFDVAFPTGTDPTRRWFVAWIDPLDEQHLAEPSWPGTEELYPFANNGAGDTFLIDPKDADPEVHYFEHETSKRLRLGVRLSEFVSAQRNYDEET